MFKMNTFFLLLVLFSFHQVHCQLLEDTQKSSKIDTLIVKGSYANEGEYPFVVSIVLWHSKRYKHFCGGTILNYNSILTAAHCLINKKSKLSRIKVLIGILSISSPKKKYVYSVRKYTTHEKYQKNVYGKYDIAILKLKTKIKFSGKVGTVCLPSENDVPAAASCVAMGWGQYEKKKKNRGKASSTLRKIHLHIKNHCGKNGAKGHVICARTNGGICFGDSGGPVMCPIKSDANVWVQYGVSSFVDSSTCTRDSYFASVRYYINWIKDHV